MLLVTHIRMKRRLFALLLINNMRLIWNEFVNPYVFALQLKE